MSYYWLKHSLQNVHFKIHKSQDAWSLWSCFHFSRIYFGKESEHTTFPIKKFSRSDLRSISRVNLIKKTTWILIKIVIRCSTFYFPCIWNGNKAPRGTFICAYKTCFFVHWGTVMVVALITVRVEVFAIKLHAITLENNTF